MLAMGNNLHVMRKYYNLKKNKDNQAKWIQNWVEKSFGMSASIPASAINFIKSTAVHPVKTTFSECRDCETDGVACQLFLQKHCCSAYCL